MTQQVPAPAPSVRAGQKAASATPRLFAPRFELLDGLRGLAALAVVLAHSTGAPFGLDAVLIFFVISGYCIAGAVDANQRSTSDRNFDLRDFMWRRLRRIYPPYLLSLVFFAATRLARAMLHRGAGPSTDLLVWLQNLTLTQWTSLIAHPMDSAGSNPTLFVAAYWSLNYEEQFYLVMGLAGLASRYLRRGFSLVFGGVTALSLLWIAWQGDQRFFGIFFEYWPQFAIGAALFFILCRAPDRKSQRTAIAALLAITLASAAAGLWPSQVSYPRLTHELLLLGTVGCLLLALRPISARIAGTPFWRPVGWLGRISYSLYLVHQFNLTLTESIAQRLVGSLGLPWLTAIVTVSAQLGIASMFWYACERPFLNRPRPTGFMARTAESAA